MVKPTELTPEEAAAAQAEADRVAADNAAIATELKRHTMSTARPDMSEFLTEAEMKVREETQRLIAAGQDPFGDDEEIVRTEEDAAELNAAAQAAATAAAEAAKEEGAEVPAEGAAEENEGTPGAEAEAGTAEAEGTQPGAELTAEQQATAEAEAAAAAALAATQAEEARVAATATNDVIVDVPDPVLMPVADAKKLEADIETVQAKLDDIDKKWTNSEISDEEKIEQSAAARRELNNVTRLQATNDAKIEANKARLAESTSQVLASIRKVATVDGIDYTKDQKAATQFDQAVNLIAQDPDNAKLTFAQIASQAHVMVAALRGIVRKPGATTTTQAKPAAAAPATSPVRVPPKAPLTLRNVPSAATSQTGGDALELGARLKGQDYEAWYARQPADVRRKLLDS